MSLSCLSFEVLLFKDAVYFMNCYSWSLQGERLSHAVGCAFTICLEKKQQREKEKLSLALANSSAVTPSVDGTNLSQRTGSFRQATLAERLTDPQSTIIAGNWLTVIVGNEGNLMFRLDYGLLCPLWSVTIRKLLCELIYICPVSSIFMSVARLRYRMEVFYLIVGVLWQSSIAL